MRKSLLLIVALLPSICLADEEQEVEATVEEAPRSPFDRPFGFGAYATGWAGAYGAGGVGARIRVQPWSRLGIDLFGEAYVVSTAFGIRHDHPIGFNLYSPFRFGSVVQLRPFIGTCVVASFIEPTESQAPRADDVLFGVHAGAGLDFALSRWVSRFVEGKAIAWMGHDRTVQGWTGALGNQIQPFVVGQGQVGVAVHLGPLR